MKKHKRLTKKDLENIDKAYKITMTAFAVIFTILMLNVLMLYFTPHKDMNVKFPKNRVSLDDLIITADSITINMEDILVLDTSGFSMGEVLGGNDSAVLFVVPETPEDLIVGDVVVYRSDEVDDTLLAHRIISMEEDKYVLAGDNNRWVDPYLVEFDDIYLVVVGVLY